MKTYRMIQRLGKISSFSGVFAVLMCYGTLFTVTVLSTIGISVEIYEGLMVKLITVLLMVALFGLIYSYRQHRKIVPLLIGILAVIILIWTFYGNYSKSLELTGFFILVVSTCADFYFKKRKCKG